LATENSKPQQLSWPREAHRAQATDDSSGRQRLHRERPYQPEREKRWKKRPGDKPTAETPAGARPGNRPNQTQQEGQYWHGKLWRERWGKAGRGKAKQLFDGLMRAESTIATLLRTEVIGLNAFLAKVGVPDVRPACPCRAARQTPKHVVVLCPNHHQDVRHSSWKQTRRTTSSSSPRSKDSRQSPGGSCSGAPYHSSNGRGKQPSARHAHIHGGS
jgi:hypothetical protein